MLGRADYLVRYRRDAPPPRSRDLASDLRRQRVVRRTRWLRHAGVTSPGRSMRASVQEHLLRVAATTDGYALWHYLCRLSLQSAVSGFSDRRARVEQLRQPGPGNQLHAGCRFRLDTKPAHAAERKRKKPFFRNRIRRQFPSPPALARWSPFGPAGTSPRSHQGVSHTRRRATTTTPAMRSSRPAIPTLTPGGDQRRRTTESAARAEGIPADATVVNGYLTDRPQVQQLQQLSPLP
jgi:hypothetical protein